MDSREAFIALNLIEGVGPVRARSLLEHFGEAPKILAASQSQLLRVHNIGEDTAARIAAWEKSMELAGENDENNGPMKWQVNFSNVVRDFISKTNEPEKS